MNRLFSALTLPTQTGPGLPLRNRALIAPMCQYSVFQRDGVPTDWHLVHLGSFAQGGFGLVTAEATAVEARGRISPEDLGLWNDAHVPAHRRITDFIHTQGAAAAVQLAHAGGKASTASGLFGSNEGSLSALQGGWDTVSSSATPTVPGLKTPQELTEAEIRDVVEAFADAAVRADTAGHDAIQLHAAHGYLLHQFLSPIINHRTDAYGGTEENRTRLVREVVDAVRQVWPTEKPIGIRISGTDWLDGGWDVEASSRLVNDLVAHHGITWVDVSSGGFVGSDGNVDIPVGPGYQVPLAARVREGLAEAGLNVGEATDAPSGTTSPGTAVPAAVLPDAAGQVSGANAPSAVVSAVGLIEEADQAETILALGAADAISVGRAALRDPHWAASAARTLHVRAGENPVAEQFTRGGWGPR